MSFLKTNKTIKINNMKPAKAIIALCTIMLAACTGENSIAETNADNQTMNISKTTAAAKAPVDETATAFPGAYGGGNIATGGRGGTVYVVTSLEDTNTEGTGNYPHPGIIDSQPNMKPADAATDWSA
jgi:hypothetical protein